jgi:hypothetical protein
MSDGADERAPTSERAETVDPAEKTQPAEGGREEAEDGDGEPNQDGQAAG